MEVLIPTDVYLDALDRIAREEKATDDIGGVKRPADEVLWLTQAIRKLKRSTP